MFYTGFLRFVLIPEIVQILLSITDAMVRFYERNVFIKLTVLDRGSQSQAQMSSLHVLSPTRWIKEGNN